MIKLLPLFVVFFRSHAIQQEINVSLDLIKRGRV